MHHSDYMQNTFIKLCTTKAINPLIKEARRVKYAVEKDAFTFTVKDGEAMVFKGVQARKGIWACTFSKDYWKDEQA